MINAPAAQIEDHELEGQVHSAHAHSPPALDSTLDPNNLYVTGLDPALNKEQLDALFSKYGRVLESKLLIDINTGLSRGAGLLRFETSQQAEAALHAMNGAHLNPNLPPILVKYAENAAHRKAKQMMRGGGRGMQSGRGGGGMYPQHMMGHHMGGPMGHPGMHPGMAPPMSMPPGGAAAASQFYGYPMMGAMAPGVPPAMPGYGMPPQHMAPPHHGGGGGGGGGGGHHPSTVPVYVANLPPDADDAMLWNLFGQYGQLHSVRIMKDATDPTGTRCRGIGFANYIRLEDAQNAIMNLHGHPLNGKSLVVNLKLPKSH